MSVKFSKKPLAIALGAAFAMGSLAAHASVFQTSDLSSGYMVAGDAKAGEAKCGEGKCGDKKAAHGKCGEGKCGEAMFKKMDANADGSVSKDEFMKAHEGKCGEGKCGDKKK